MTDCNQTDVLIAAVKRRHVQAVLTDLQVAAAVDHLGHRGHTHTHRHQEPLLRNSEKNRGLFVIIINIRMTLLRTSNMKIKFSLADDPSLCL